MVPNTPRRPSPAVLVLALAFIMISRPTAAQVHADGSCWIHRDAETGTMVHALADPLCTAEFPAGCYGGMMGPDSLLCIVESQPPDGVPHPLDEDCPVVLHCEILDPDGQIMMPGHMTPMGLFRHPIDLAVHYDPSVIGAAGIDVADLVLTMWDEGAYTIIDVATHDIGSSTFLVATNRLAEWYGVGDRSVLPTSVGQSSWGRIKATYR